MKNFFKEGDERIEGKKPAKLDSKPVEIHS